MKVSFDFDSTLSRPIIQKYAQELINKGIEVWICTSRVDDEEALKRWKLSGHNDDLFLVAAELKIPKERIIFTNYNNKVDFLRDKNFIWHLDDDVIELSFFKGEKTTGISCYATTTWKEKCEKLLNSATKR